MALIKIQQAMTEPLRAGHAARLSRYLSFIRRVTVVRLGRVKSARKQGD